MCAVFKFHGSRAEDLLKKLNFFQNMLKNQNLSSAKSKSQHQLNWSIIIIN